MAARKKGEPPNRKKTTVRKTTLSRKTPSNPRVGDMWHYSTGTGKRVKKRYTAKGWVDAGTYRDPRPRKPRKPNSSASEKKKK